MIFVNNTLGERKRQPKHDDGARRSCMCHPYSGRDAIKRYWETKVIGEQEDIHFELLNAWMVDQSTAIAEWHATFTDTKRALHIDMTEVAIFGIRDGKFCSLREYYKSIKTPL